MSGIIKMVHRTDHPDGPFKTIKEVAEYLERDISTVRRYGRELGLPTHKMQLGEHENAFVWLYTEDDIAAMETHMEGLNSKGGRKKQTEEKSGS